VLVLPATPSYAQWSEHGIPVYTQDGQGYPGAIADGADGAIIVTQDQRPSVQGVFAQRVSGAGSLLWNSNGVPVGTAGNGQYQPVIAADGAGGAIVAWVDYRTGTPLIFAQHVNASGQALWASNGIRLNTSGRPQYGVVIVGDGSGGAIASWIESSSSPALLFAQHVSSSGTLLWGDEAQVASAAGGGREQLDAIPDGSGGVIVAWDESRGADANIYAQKVAADGSVMWGTDGVLACAATGNQLRPRVAADDNGGAFIAWSDFRSSVDQVFVQHLDPNGTATLASDGIVSSAAGGRLDDPAVSRDGVGGVVVAWIDWRSGERDIFAQRINETGSRLWGPQDRALCSARADQSQVLLTTDGTGEIFAAWQDFRKVAPDVYEQSLDLSGTAKWTADGVALGATGLSSGPSWLVQDGSGGSLVGWISGQTQFAQRILADGSLGYFQNLRGNLTAVTDEPGDQGGWVRLAVTAASGDVEGISPLVTGYGVWRRAVAPLVESPEQPRASHEQLNFGEAVRHVGLVVTPAQAASLGFPPGAWESMGFHPATQSSSYLLLAPTHADSTADGIPSDVFVVTVHTTNPLAFTVSQEDSGYSVDNLAPPTPAPFTATYGSTSNLLHWSASRARDLLEYRLFRGTGSEFLPAAANLIAATSDTGFTDTPGGYFYKLVAVDVHGNVSHYAQVSPQQPVATLASLVSVDAEVNRIRLAWYSASGASVEATVYRRETMTDWRPVGAIASDGTGFLRFEDDAVTAGTRYGYRLGITDGGTETFLGEAWTVATQPEFALEGAIPNPSPNGRLNVQFVLPTDERASLELIDITGRHVATREIGSLGPGRHNLDLAERAHLPAGVYLVRFTQGDRVQTRRAVVLN
jgi:hypothetical protein